MLSSSGPRVATCALIALDGPRADTHRTPQHPRPSPANTRNTSQTKRIKQERINNIQHNVPAERRDENALCRSLQPRRPRPLDSAAQLWLNNNNNQHNVMFRLQNRCKIQTQNKNNENKNKTIHNNNLLPRSLKAACHSLNCAVGNRRFSAITQTQKQTGRMSDNNTTQTRHTNTNLAFLYDTPCVLLDRPKD